MNADHYRQIPAVSQVLQDSRVAPLIPTYGHEAVADAVRKSIDQVRTELKSGGQFDESALVTSIAAQLQSSVSPRLRRVINATGVILHTNLGRAPLAESAVQAAAEAARGYLNLEIDLATGKRSHRHDAIRGWLCRLLNCESATAVNNCAAATVLVLRALAAGREVIVSRGQLVEIGGSFRIPEIMAVSGARLREVGTTNITRLGDYESAIGSETALLMRVHQSNYRVRGFTQMPAIDELVALGRKHQLPVIDDIGSGALVDYSQWNLLGEPLAADSLRAGADLVLYSGDKLLGGPQAGVIAGRRDLIQRVERDPLMRAFRLDKMTLAALEATLRLYVYPEKALAEIPVLRQLSISIAELRHRAQRIANQIPGATVRDDVTFVGGGSLPDESLPTVVIVLKSSEGEDPLARRLRLGSPAVVARVQGGEVLLDMRSVMADEDQTLLAAVTSAIC